MSYSFKWRTLQALLTFAAFTSIMLLGFAVLSWQTTQDLHNDADERLSLAVKQIDTMLDNGGRAVENLTPYLDQACSQDVILALRKQVSTMANIRTAYFANNGLVYCSAVFGAGKIFEDTQHYVNGRLLFISDNIITPNHPLIAYHQIKGINSITVGVDGHYVNTVLNLLSSNNVIILKIGDQWMGREGNIHKESYMSSGVSISLPSENYPYQVLTFIPQTNRWFQVIFNAPWRLLIFAALGVVVGILTFLALGQHRSPLANLKSGLANQEFVPYFQPLVNGSDYQLTGCEVLMRWQHPQMGLIPPYQFIPLAEESGLIVPMTRQLMKQTSTAFAAISQQLPDHFHFGINICAGHFTDLSLVEDCRAFLHSFKDKPITLVLELTERELIVPSPLTEKIFKALRHMGVRIALDDFGTGHSSLAYLQMFHIDIIKIDQSFISRIGKDSLSGHIVDNVIDLAKRLEMIVVAEGVENQVQLDYLTVYHLHYLQGYYFGKPVAFGEFIRDFV